MKAYLFDLDGVLADSRPGLYLSFRAALKAIGVADVTDDALGRFLGTPLPEMFRTLKPAIARSEIAAGIKAFRAVYERDGIKQNHRYPGVHELLQAMVHGNASAWIVTSKPEFYAKQVAEFLGLDRYLSGVVGAGLEETDTKAGLIARALLQANVAGDAAIMLGDRHYDIAGALANNVLPVGALWGYGSRDELYEAGCRHFAQSPDEFRLEYVDGANATMTGAGRSFA